MIQLARLPFQPDIQPAWYGPVGYIAAIVGVAAATGMLWIAQPLLSLGSVYLVYLVVVVAVAVGWGLKQGIVASLAAFLAANYFFIEPRFTFSVAEAQDVLALIVFLGLATLTSQLVARLRREAHEARLAQQVTATLYALSQTINRQHDIRSLLQEVSVQLCTVLNLDACTILLTGVEEIGNIAAYAGSVLRDDTSVPRLIRTSLVAGSRNVGVVLLQQPAGKRALTVGEQQLLAAFAEQLSLAIERALLQQVSVQTEVLRRTDELRVALLSAVAHDLRTPLGSIKAAATGLLSHRIAWSVEEQREFLEDIAGEADHVNHLVSNLLDMSRIEAGQLHPQKELQRIEEVIKQVAARLQRRLDRHPLYIDIDTGLPLVAFDEVEIDAVLTNLLENANKHTPPGTAIYISVERASETIRVTVSDNGLGVAEEHLTHLFDRFYRVQGGGTGGVQGSGLGLAIAKGIIEAHGGLIAASNGPQGGLSITFTLPIASEEQSLPEAQALAYSGGV